MQGANVKNYTHDEYMDYLNMKLQELKNNESSTNLGGSKNYLDGDIKNSYSIFFKYQILYKNLDRDGDLIFLIDYHENKTNRGLFFLPENEPLDYADSGIVLSEQKPYSYLKMQEYADYLPTNSQQERSQKSLKQHGKKILSITQSNYPKNYLSPKKKQYDTMSQKNGIPIFQRSYEDIIVHRKDDSEIEIVDQKYLISQFLHLNDQVKDLEQSINSKELAIHVILNEGRGDVPYNFRLSKLQVDQNRCSFLLSQLISLEKNRIHSPYYERVRQKLQTVEQLLDQLSKVERFYAEIFEIYDYLIINITYLQNSMIQEVKQKLEIFIEKQRKKFLTKKEIDELMYIQSQKKIKSMPEKFKNEMMNLLNSLENLERMEQEISEDFCCSSDTKKLFSFNYYIVKLQQFQDTIKQKIQRTGEEGLLTITKIMYNKVIDSASAIIFRYFADYENIETDNKFLFAEEIYKQKKLLKDHINNNQILNYEQLQNIHFLYEQVVVERRQTEDLLLRKVFKKFIKIRKAYLKKTGQYKKND